MDVFGGLIGGITNLLDDFIFTDEERMALEAQKAATQAQMEAARLAQEQAMLEAAARARQAQALTVAAVTVGAALVMAVLVWRWT